VKTDRFRLRAYCDAVFVAGAAVVAASLLGGDRNVSYIWDSPLPFATLAAGVMLGEMLPVKIPRRGGDEEITLSTSFSLALLIIGGLVPALLAQGAASMIQDRHAGKPWWRVRFNLGQYALSMGAALGVMELFGITGRLSSSKHVGAKDLAALSVAAAVFFVVNNGVVGIAVAWYQQVPFRRYFSNDARFVIVTGGVMLMVAPLVVAATWYSTALVPLFLAPIFAMYNTVWQSARDNHAARHDLLTSLPNRSGFQDAVAATLTGCRRESCLLLIDLDRFKDVNDTLGHHFGDVLLKHVAQRFRDALGPQDHIARLGGDEFAIIGTGRDRESARELALRITDSLRAPFDLEGVVVGTQASVGIAMFPDDAHEVERLLQKADVAMYRAKATRSGVLLYDECHDDNSPAKLALTAGLRSAIDANEIEVHYQPQLDLVTRRVIAVEALVRWNHPDLGLLAPDQFIEIAEHTNVIKPLTARVLELALEQSARWRELGIDVPVAVNISAHVLVGDEFSDQVLAAIQTAGASADRLKLEVTESALLVDPQRARQVLKSLARLGVQSAIDDFGTGYSSLAYLAELPVSEVKIDRSFVGRMAAGSSETIIVNSTIDLAHHLGLRAVAEGVEQFSQLEQLRALGCDAVQGFAISAPMTAEKATAWLLVHQPADAPDGYVFSS
jgi:diguanylate cyclase (GGDEF)-like protein